MRSAASSSFAPRSGEATSGAATFLRPRYFRLPAAVEYSGLCRSTIYQHIGTGAIRSKVLRQKGSTRGIRLILVESLDQFLDNLPEGSPKGSNSLKADVIATEEEF